MSTALVTGLPGGAQEDSVTTSEVYMDLAALAGCEVLIWSDDQDLWFCFTSAASGTLVTSGDSAASRTSLKADRVATGTKVRRLVELPNTYLAVKTVTGSATVHVKVCRGQL